MEEADVSIVVANYNQSEYLTVLIKSIVESTRTPRELIIVDDASTDNSLEVINIYSKLPYLKLIRSTNNQGFANALNMGIENASAKYIMRVDPDDFIHSTRIQIQFDYLERNPNIDLIGGNLIYVNKRGEEIFRSNVVVDERAIVASLKAGEIPLFHGTLMGRREVFTTIPFRQEWVKAEDYDFLTRVERKGYRITNVAGYLTYYRIHTRNASRSGLWATFRKIYALRKDRYNVKVKPLPLISRYLHMYFYRLFLRCTIQPIAYFLLFISGLFCPIKIIQRIRRRSRWNS